MGTPKLALELRGYRGRKAWFATIALAAVPVVLSTVLVSLAGLGGDDGPIPSLLFQVMWWAWAVGSIGAAALAGVVGGIRRGLCATFVVWFALAATLFVALPPECPLQMSQLPRGVAVLVAADVTCLGGGVPSHWDTIGFVILGAFFALVLATAGGTLRLAAAWASRRQMRTELANETSQRR